MNFAYLNRHGRTPVFFFLLTASVVVLLCFGETPALAKVRISIEPGVDGWYTRDGLPVKVTLDNRGKESVFGHLSVLDVFIENVIPIDIPPYSKKSKWIHIYPKWDRNPEVRFSTKEITLQKEVSVRRLLNKKRVVLYISQEPGKSRRLRKAFRQKYRLIELNPRQLWDLWDGYQVDFVIFDASSIELVNDHQWKALKRYVLSGGVMYITGNSYPGIYNHPLLKDLLPVRIDGLNELKPGFLYPNSPGAKILSLKGDNESVLYKVKGLALWAVAKAGLGSIVFLSFDPADEAFHPWMKERTDLWALKKNEDSLNHVPAGSWSKEVSGLFLNLAKWNIGYLLLLVPIGFIGVVWSRKVFWLSITFLFFMSIFASWGILNGKDRLKVITLINTYSGEEESFLQSRVSLLSANRGEVDFDFHDGFIRFRPGSEPIHKLTLIQSGSSKKLRVNLGVFDNEDFMWERFEKLGSVLDVALKVQLGRIKGKIRNLTKYPIKNTLIWMNGRSFPFPAINGESEISIDIKTSDASSYPYSTDWIKRFLNNKTIGMGFSRDIIILGFWERPTPGLDKTDFKVEEELSIIIYHTT